jgi:cell fate regulator YaaT (PSP1 superfamily)
LTEVISVRFKNKGKAYFFDPNGVTAQKGDSVIVETSKGLEFAECVIGNHQVADDALILPLRPVVRIATDEDKKRAVENSRREEEAMEICSEKIRQHGLDMKLVDVEFNFEGTKILFFFTSDGRVDFRDLVKDLASVFKTRIELRQIGVRDEARMLGGLGICGKPFCCAQFLDDFQPVSIKMAKTQGLSLNPTKISGTCGRLMCCLKYEQDAYEDLVKNAPKVDAFVDTPAGKGSVMDVNLLRRTARVHMEETADSPVKVFDFDELEVLGGKAKRAEYLQNQERLKAEGLLEKPAHPPRQAPKLDVTSELAPKPAPKTGAKEEAQPPKREKRQHKPPYKKEGESSGAHKHQKPKPAEAQHQKPKPADTQRQKPKPADAQQPEKKHHRQGQKPQHTPNPNRDAQKQEPKQKQSEAPHPSHAAESQQHKGGHKPGYRKHRYNKPKNHQSEGSNDRKS